MLVGLFISQMPTKKNETKKKTKKVVEESIDDDLIEDDSANTNEPSIKKNKKGSTTTTTVAASNKKRKGSITSSSQDETIINDENNEIDVDELSDLEVAADEDDKQNNQDEVIYGSIGSSSFVPKKKDVNPKTPIGSLNIEDILNYLIQEGNRAYNPQLKFGATNLLRQLTGRMRGGIGMGSRKGSKSNLKPFHQRSGSIGDESSGSNRFNGSNGSRSGSIGQNDNRNGFNGSIRGSRGYQNRHQPFNGAHRDDIYPE